MKVRDLQKTAVTKQTPGRIKTLHMCRWGVNAADGPSPQLVRRHEGTHEPMGCGVTSSLMCGDLHSVATIPLPSFVP